MDPQIRNFRDFLQLYNKLTETCFLHCTNNFFNRDLSSDETNCVDKCVTKFSNVNQKVMAVYVEAQTAINAKRMAEFEMQLKQQEEQAALQQQQQQQSLNETHETLVNPVQVTT
ncbi:Mitochondrial import inner membrane translocase subunit Tim10B [Pseudolycoriella hygida]|uniref:Mitochondrial import inner membrane translocase subunit n=1 Tax=Pseudolycoriella hygida TaxID=35572 RepID=A0A9Q0MQ64_9DIPT|nr:Mitochondrial import inner membrane translocase subunit Tim10B [Pseudolycoriella hygida]